jgi:hypothetical protein
MESTELCIQEAHTILFCRCMRLCTLSLFVCPHILDEFVKNTNSLVANSTVDVAAIILANSKQLPGKL